MSQFWLLTVSLEKVNIIPQLQSGTLKHTFTEACNLDIVSTLRFSSATNSFFVKSMFLMFESHCFIR